MPSSTEETCPQKAGIDTDLVRLLLGHGTRLDGEALIGSIQGENPYVLEVLLSAGAHPDVRRERAREAWQDGRDRHSPLVLTPDKRNIERHEWYPLYNAVRLPPMGTTDSKGLWGELARTLLRHVANPFAVFSAKVTDGGARRYRGFREGRPAPPRRG